MDMSMEARRSSIGRRFEGLYLKRGWCYGGFKATPGLGWCFAHLIAPRRAAPIRGRLPAWTASRPAAFSTRRAWARQPNLH
jgi:sarcosine oxidase subunit beta